MLSERLQIVVSPDQRKRLEAEAKLRQESVGSLVRQAIDALVGTGGRDERLRAVDEIRRMHGRHLSPEELDRIAAGEREEEIGQVVRRRRR